MSYYLEMATQETSRHSEGTKRLKDIYCILVPEKERDSLNLKSEVSSRPVAVQILNRSGV